jgi:hypothetical protein
VSTPFEELVAATVDRLVRTLEWHHAAATVALPPVHEGEATITVQPQHARGARLDVRVRPDSLLVAAGLGFRVEFAVDPAEPEEALERVSSIMTRIALGRMTERLRIRDDGTTSSRGAPLTGEAEPLRILGLTLSLDRLFGRNAQKVTYPAYPPGVVTRVELPG